MPQNSDESESRFKTLVTYTPGLVFQFQFGASGELIFGYLSEGCKALLDIEDEVLKKSPQRFLEIMDETDRTQLLSAIRESANTLKMLNWEGRVHIATWKDIKWINMRSMPRKLADGTVQWEGIMTNITQSKLEKQELEESRQRLMALSAHLTRIKEEERGRISREIHDDLGGNLTAIKIGLASILKHLPAEQHLLVEKTKQLEAIVDNTFEAAHRISGDLRPNILELGIVAALEWQAKEFYKQIGIPCDFESNQPDAAETKDQAITLFRVCQEAMSNIAKHAQADRVRLMLSSTSDGITMHIADNGIGLAASDMLKPNSFGLRGMQERVVELGGEFQVLQAKPKGTEIRVKLPR